MQKYLSLFKNLLHAPVSIFSGKSSRRLPGNASFLLSALLFCLVTLLPLPASSDNPYLSTFFDIPLEYGKVVYRINENSPKQLYIIGISHRDPESGLNGSTTIQTQADIFRIGEWLNRNRELQLLLPEGYFTERKSSPAITSQPSRGQLDNFLLRQKLADESRFVNAEMLLMENIHMRASQVEDRNIYNAVCTSLRNLKTPGTPISSPKEKIEQLQYLQEVRTAMLLQKIPSVIDYELHNGTIKNQSAMLTIGLNHIQDIVRYFQKDGIDIDTPASADIQPTSYQTELNLLKMGYGVTIIIPRTLVDDSKLLQLTNIDRILLAYSSQTGKEWMN
ncbi:MAG: hypothetical protein VR65_12685 [Desulfobulbaceae bacterium BRH_c16a]|nr:MAG: hypothetical protein VR65_12685 [Desulfobulbaceae bacterium BRH_c16a]